MEKICESCGRRMEFRRRWEKNWEAVKYCSDECRRNKLRFDYRPEILALLAERGAGKTICPSEVLVGEQKQDARLMELVRRSARLLAHAGLVEITQKGVAVDPSDFRGPIRLRLRSAKTD